MNPSQIDSVMNSMLQRGFGLVRAQLPAGCLHAGSPSNERSVNRCVNTRETCVTGLQVPGCHNPQAIFGEAFTLVDAFAESGVSGWPKSDTSAPCGPTRPMLTRLRGLSTQYQLDMSQLLRSPLRDLAS